jgi:ABC-type transport system substrate-binding protein
LLTVHAVARTRPAYGGSIRIEVAGDPWERPGGLARQLVFDGLTSIGADGSPLPALALDWKSESEDHHWQFRLRPGVHFHDGTAVTAVNVVASLNAACTGNCPWTGLRAVGSSVVFTSDSPMPNLPWLLAGDDYRIALSNSGSSAGAQRGIGTGPYQLSGFMNGVWTFAANENCWNGRPFADTIEIHVHRAIRDQWLDLNAGRADLVEVPAEQIRQAREQHLNVLASQPVTLLALTVSDSGPLANANLRAAIAFAVDRNSLSNVIYQKQCEVTASLLPSALTGYSFLFPTDRDLNKAHEVRGGLSAPTLTLAAGSGATMQLTAQRIALNLHEAGFNVQTVAEGGTRPADLTLRRIPVESSRPGPALDSVLRHAGVAAPVGEESPAELYRVEREVLSSHAVVPLLFLPRAWAVGTRLQSLRLSVEGSPQIANASVGDAK